LQQVGDPPSTDAAIAVTWINTNAWAVDVYLTVADTGEVSPFSFEYAVQPVGGDSCSAAIDLASVSSPYTLNTNLGGYANLSAWGAGCGYSDISFLEEYYNLEVPTVYFTAAVPAGHTLTVVWDDFYLNAIHELRIGELCPGEAMGMCTSLAAGYSATSVGNKRITWTNTLGSTQQVYLMQSLDVSLVSSAYSTYILDSVGNVVYPGNDATVRLEGGWFTLRYKIDEPAAFSNCFRSKADTAPIPGCMCHETCATCGYSDWPSDAWACLTCPEGSTVFPFSLEISETGFCGDDSFEYTPIEDSECSSGPVGTSTGACNAGTCAESKFCNMDNGDSGWCESCPYNLDDCYTNGLPNGGEDQCASMCFGNQIPPCSSLFTAQGCQSLKQMGVGSASATIYTLQKACLCSGYVFTHASHLM